MSRTLTIIMLDFFIMISIAFFILQYIQPDDEANASAASKPPYMIISVSVQREEFYKAIKVSSSPLPLLLDLDFILVVGGQEFGRNQLITANNYDGATIIYQGRATGEAHLIVFPKLIRSFQFVKTAPQLKVKLLGGQGNEKRAILDFTHSVAIDVSLD